MKNILIAFGVVITVVLLFVAVSTAETPKKITIINSGKAGGSFNARTQMSVSYTHLTLPTKRIV